MGVSRAWQIARIVARRGLVAAPFLVTAPRSYC